MTGARWRNGVVGIVLCSVAAALLMAGCSPTMFSRTRTSASKPRTNQPVAIYREFGDVLIPSALAPDNDASYIVETPGLATGVLALSGRVQRNSLIDFFNHNMVKDNWRRVTVFKSPQTSTILLWRKENRWCIISIQERGFYTYVQIGVAPSMNAPASPLSGPSEEILK